jgi:hypothetical protein
LQYSKNIVHSVFQVTSAETRWADPGHNIVLAGPGQRVLHPVTRRVALMIEQLFV